jgi:hypothetical protein
VPGCHGGVCEQSTLIPWRPVSPDRDSCQFPRRIAESSTNLSTNRLRGLNSGLHPKQFPTYPDVSKLTRRSICRNN